jgi:hypothetical protein
VFAVLVKVVKRVVCEEDDDMKRGVGLERMFLLSLFLYP